MAEVIAARRQLLKTGLVLAFIYLLVQLAYPGDFLAACTQPFVLWTLEMLGQQVAGSDGGMIVGEVFVPWSRDCAGLNVLALLLALVVWSLRQETRVSRYLTAVVAAVAIGFVANVCRILSLVGYRTLFYPNVESAELHYLIGFAWLLPAVLGIALMLGRGLGHVRIPVSYTHLTLPTTSRV